MSIVECISLNDMSTVTPPASAVLCLGNFDGMHLAHQALIRRAKDLRDSHLQNAVCGVFCFRKPSWCFLSKNPPKQLCTLTQKLEAMRNAGVEYVYLADFPSISSLTPNEFLEKILVDSCRAVGVVCGFNYRFGVNGSGSSTDLLAFFGENASVVGEIQVNCQTVSSTRIRTLLNEGDVRRAALFLGKPYALTAPVVHGKSLGKKLGAPTLNQFFPHEQLIPKCGVYATQCKVDGKTYRGVSNVGIRPTVDKDASINCETYLIGFCGNLYERELTVEFLEFLRPEQKFSSPEDLALQIQSDIEAAVTWQASEVDS
jgi:riboflavin kinase/FMN adenylyltransferase